MAAGSPIVVVIAGPNGAGKSTTAPRILRENFGVEEFVNADTIAAGLSALRPESVAVAAGRLMLRRMRELAARRISFGFETTLATRRFARWLADLQQAGYAVTVLFFALPHVDMAIARVRERVRAGGHDVPEATIRRRFRRGLANLARDYIPLADEWIVFDNSVAPGPRLVAEGGRATPPEVHDEAFWKQLRSRA
ncbi:MAG TPA: zeta toxin family protein [Planctomycetota bacterium]|nr:zeta toxin family protein [Planctomycetota bacterium]